MNRLVAVAIGSNTGDRAAYVDYAVERLRTLLDGVSVSSLRETAPAPPAAPSDPAYLNAVLVGRTAMPPRDLLEALLAVERERGRERPRRGAPRTLDLDIVLFGDLIVSEPGLEVPHPRFRERRFVLDPLAEVAPGMVDPVTGLTVRALLERCQAAVP